MDVSIIIPCLDDRWLPECLASLPEGAEVIVIRDPDKFGPGWARNEGLRKATRDYIFFCDADDTAGDVQALVDAMEKTEADIVVGAFEKRGLFNAVVKDFDVMTRVDQNGLGDYVRKNLANPRHHQMLNGCWAKLFRRQIIKERGIWFDYNLRTAEDLDFVFDYLRICRRIVFIPEITYHYHKREGSLTTTPDIGMTDVLQVIRKLASYGDIGQSFIYHAILYIIRAPKLAGFIMAGPEFKRHIRRYKPAPGNYRLLPWLMRLGFVKPVEWAARHIYGA